MEHGEGSSGKRPPAAGLTVKRLMKSPSQVQILEEAYAVESNPSTMMKADLARRTGLEYTQVQYWFGNRRFLDKHGPRTNTPRIDRHGLLWEFNPDRTSSMSPVTVARAGPAPNGSVYSVETLPTMRAAGQSTVNPGLVPEPAFMPRLEYGDVHALEAEAPRAVREFQFFPIQPSWLQKSEDVNQTGFLKSSVNTSHKVSDDCHVVTPDAERGHHLFPSSSKVVFHDDSYYKTEKTQVSTFL
ncbi:hypothetical protein BHM03_00002938 [Ensete ventricosum]|nr:hypothetical protein BHM03_00002938 [Ensete ventricosum]